MPLVNTGQEQVGQAQTGAALPVIAAAAAEKVAQVRPRTKSPGVALITGAASGIGRELACQLAGRGWTIAALDRNAAGLHDMGNELARALRPVAWRASDVTDAALLELDVAKLVDELGPIDLLVAAAGIASATPAATMAPEAIARIIGVNLIGVSNTIAAVLPGMLARQRGHIVAISSLASIRGLPGMMGYCASKAGINALMESLRLDVKHQGVAVSTICPGYTRTPQSVGMYKDEYLMPVEAAAARIVRAIERRSRFHAFPWSTFTQLRLLNLIPGWLQDWLLHRSSRKAAKG